MLQWKKKVGDSVAADETLIEIETDKVVLEVPAPSAGVLAEILVLDGGAVRERGDHRTLLAHGGSYAAAWRRQTEAHALESGPEALS
jgi:2-oxoglutarate dehydrogenase E2 component (dihydrolipoamide succinyltransferase)